MCHWVEFTTLLGLEYLLTGAFPGPWTSTRPEVQPPQTLTSVIWASAWLVAAQKPESSETGLPPPGLSPAQRMQAPPSRAFHASSLSLVSARSPRTTTVPPRCRQAITHASFPRMGALLILIAAAGALAAILAVRLWLVLHSQATVPRKSVSLMVVAGSGEYGGGDRRIVVGLQTPECTATPPPVSSALCAHCSPGVVVSPEPTP